MNPSGPHNVPSPGLPDEADLLAWVEGEALSPEANAAVARALLADPALARRLELMRRDREVLCSLPRERAPRDLVAGVEAALQPVLERELLLGLQSAEPAESVPVVSMVRPEKRGIFQTFLADRAGRRMALAASLLLLIGGATWWAAVSFTGKPSPIKPIALNDGSRAKSLSADSPPDAIMTGTEASAALATAEATAPEATPMVASAVESAAAKEEEAASRVASVEELVGPVRTAMDAALAAELARERKLVVRVVSREAALAPRRVCDRVRKELNSPAIKLAAEVPPELTVALDVRPLDVPRLSPAAVPEPPAFAGLESVTPFIGPPAPREAIVIEETEPQPLYVVQARLDAATMTQLRTSLERAGRDEVVFEERYEPLPLSPGGAPVLTPQAVLWWSNPPAGWTSWGEVPVVIEPK
jgi:hypothetical protein